LGLVKGKTLAKVIDELIEKTPSKETADSTQETTAKFQEAADMISTFIDNGYESLDQIHDANVAHTHIEANKCIVKKNGRFCWIDFTRARRLDMMEDSNDVELIKHADIGDINYLIQRLSYQLGVSCKFEDEGVSSHCITLIYLDSSEDEDNAVAPGDKSGDNGDDSATVQQCNSKC
jgi:hypothetical protein